MEDYLERMSVVAVSIAMNTAICFVCDLEEDLLRQYPQRTSQQNMLLFYTVQCWTQGYDPDAKQRQGDLFKFCDLQASFRRIITNLQHPWQRTGDYLTWQDSSLQVRAFWLSGR